MQDVFTPNAFKQHDLTMAINKLPYKPGRIGSLGLFSSDSVFTTHVDIEFKGGKLSLVQTQPRGSRTGVKITDTKRKLRTFKIPHLPQFATITPDDVPNIRPFGTNEGRMQWNSVIASRLNSMRYNLDVTVEYHMIGAIKGVILDADGSTIYDLYSEFGISEEEIPLVMDGSETIRGQIPQLERYVQDRLGAATYTKLHAFCGDKFFDVLVELDELKAAYERPQEGAFLRNTYTRSAFEYGGIIWENYRGQIGSVEFCAENEARIVPMGVPNLFIRRNGPADTVSAVGRPGQEYVVTREFLPHDSGVELKAQANPLIICTDPSVLVKLTMDSY